MPCKLDSGFEKADSSNLPKISIFMVWEYLVTDDRYNAPEVRGVKASVNARESYGDSAIGYVSVKRQNNLCTVKGRICPEHRVRQKAYQVLMEVDEEEEKIKTLKCLDCAASEGGCKHGVAFLMWGNRRSESASPTDVECYWKKPTLSNVGTSMKFITASEMAKYSLTSAEDFGDNSTFLQKVIAEAEARQVDSQLSRYTITLTEREVHSLSIHQLLSDFCSNNEDSFDDFVNYATQKMLQNLCMLAENKTRDQKNNVLWHELRFGRITASNIYEASRCKTPDGSLVKRIIGAAKTFDNMYMERGRKLEDQVIAELKKQLDVDIIETGLFLLPSRPIFGASPDGMGDDFVVEVKCPSSSKTVKNYISDGKISDKCRGQINLQMMCTGKKKGLFCVADPDFEKNNQIQFMWIEYEEKYIRALMKKAENFWKNHVFPILLNAMAH
ncbi:uncharacterized protein LOC122512804 [Leptopilina heterotoma]|uniref:uncharacterized protein LOC122512804 n=1 Tax=Leptopilina heterotoma TaxID=63436 RepID=UPI001CA7BD8F|nr:uncharacterized protein LOC122512804 [Leptopilina heterotoma]